MEVTNNSRFYSIPLVVGRRIAQIIFFDVGATMAASYVQDGKYQTKTSQDELMRTWQPSDMLPKMYLDRECVASTR